SCDNDTYTIYTHTVSLHDALPISDITNNQVQINTVYAALSPTEIETQVTYPVETALAGIPGLQYTRSISRNGFSQVTAVFDDDRSEEHTSELQSRENLVCRLLLEK